MSHLVIIFDLIAGLLVGMHLWVPGKYRRNWDGWLLGKLSPEDNPVDEKTFKWSFAVTTVVIAGIVIWGYSVDINQGAFTAQELLNVSLLVVAGIPLAVLFIVGVIMLYQRITFIHGVPLTVIISILAVCTAILTLLLISTTNQVVDRIIIGFVFSVAFLTLSIQLIPLVRRFLTFESGVLARLGVTIFVISRFIQIANVL